MKLCLHCFRPPADHAEGETNWMCPAYDFSVVVLGGDEIDRPFTLQMTTSLFRLKFLIADRIASRFLVAATVSEGGRGNLRGGGCFCLRTEVPALSKAVQPE